MKDLFDRETGSSAMGCWPALGHDVTDVGITLRQGSTGQWRDALREALRADPLVREPVFESRNAVLAVHREVHRPSQVPFVAAATPRLRRIAYLMCRDWHLPRISPR